MKTESILVGSLFVLGMSVPVISSLLAPDVLSLYLSGPQFTSLVAVAFVLIAWAFLEVVGPDRVSFFTWALVFPWLFTVGIVVVGISTEMSPGLRYLFRNIGSSVVYAASFMIAGFASLVIRERVGHLSGRYRRVPSGRSIAFAVLIVTVIGFLLGGGLFTVSAMSASVSHVEPGVVDHRTSTLNVTLEDSQTEMRLRVTGPEGNTYISRIKRSTKQSESVTVPVRFYRDLDSAPSAGTYHIELTALSGITVDRATYSVDKAPSPSVLTVRTAGAGETLTFDVPDTAIIYRPSKGPTDTETRVAVIIRNTGDVAAHFDTVVQLAPDQVASREIFVKPGQVGVNVIAIQDEYVTRLHEQLNSTVTVEVGHEGTRIVNEVPLPRS